ncbi:MAG: saccharopine dehydrogenase NADP-binding domain-containing protein [Acidobacteria bacterium]|nr:saccharopine dehydrogenase NADP-binding domain-containing protein [Acidobacteriota bacterium]
MINCAMITILAATGYTGQLIARELQRQQLPVRLAARSAAKLKALVNDLGEQVPTLAADASRPETLPPVFEGTRVLINCAGPFIDLGEPVVAEAVRQGVHYLDTTGEQAFIKLVFDQYGEEAKRRGIVLAPATAFEYAMSDAAAEIAAKELEPCEEIAILYATPGFSASQGTKKSMLRVLSSEGYLYRDGRLVLAQPGAERRPVYLPNGKKVLAVSFPGGEVIQVPKHVQTRAVIPMMAFDTGTAALLRLGLPLLRAVMATPARHLIFRGIEAGSIGPTEAERAASRFTLLCEARRGEDRRAVIAEGADPYGLTAVLAAGIAARLLKEEPREFGAVSPAMIAGPDAILEMSRAAGVSWLY